MDDVISLENLTSAELIEQLELKVEFASVYPNTQRGMVDPPYKWDELRAEIMSRMGEE